MPLFIKIEPVVNDYFWKNHPSYKKAYENRDCGLDIPMQKSVIIPAGEKSFKVNLNIKTDPSHGYMLLPRSSLSKTCIRLSNSVGIIDKKYRGEVMAVVDNIGDKDETFTEGSCYFQIVAFDGNLPRYQIDTVSEDTSRGTGGFGSTTAVELV